MRIDAFVLVTKSHLMLCSIGQAIPSNSDWWFLQVVYKPEPTLFWEMRLYWPYPCQLVPRSRKTIAAFLKHPFDKTQGGSCNRLGIFQRMWTYLRRCQALLVALMWMWCLLQLVEQMSYLRSEIHLTKYLSSIGSYPSHFMNWNQGEMLEMPT